MIRKFLLVISFIAALQTKAEIKLPQLIRDSMILQRDEKINLWGWAAVKEKVTVKFNGHQYKTIADNAGTWKIQIPPTKAGGPYQIEIIGTNKILLQNILFGDVWFCSGQSNMVHQLNIHDVRYANEIKTANYPAIRQFLVPVSTHLQAAQTNITKSYWKAAVGEDVRPFSAVAYFFAKKLYEQYKIPIGIINASVGGIPIEAWISEEGFNHFSDIQQVITKNKDSAYINTTNRKAAIANKQEPGLDAGLTESIPWFDQNYQAKGWRLINIPGYWEDQGITNLNGVVWYRREIEIPASITTKQAKVYLGRIVDADELYINGQRVGSTGYQYPQRRYTVPANLLKTGKNIFVIRVTNTAGKGGFVPDKPYCLFVDQDTIDLKGSWQYKVGLAYQPSKNKIFLPSINPQNEPTALYNAMVAPLIHYSIKGICWYQGESNTSKAKEYQQLLPTLINDWRTKWNNASLPFLFVQLPGFMEYNYSPAESQWAVVREAQFKSLSLPNTGMAVAIDLGEWNDIHPDNKKDVGERLALAAMKTAYHENIVASGPLFQSATINDHQIEISFTEIGTGLIAIDGEALTEFAIAGADKVFVWAKAIIKNNKVIVWSDAIQQPVYVRYAWADNPVNPNLFNREGLPASPFRTDQ